MTGAALELEEMDAVEVAVPEAQRATSGTARPFPLRVKIASPEESANTQKALFDMGCAWPGGNRNVYTGTPVVGIVVRGNRDMYFLVPGEESVFDGLPHRQLSVAETQWLAGHTASEAR